MRKMIVGVMVMAAMVAGTVASSEAGWHGRVWVGPRVVIGAPFYFGPAYYYPRPYVYAPPPVVVAAPAPPVYVQSQPSYWYYCQSPAGYYPSVPQCPGGWMTVAPQPQQ